MINKKWIYQYKIFNHLHSKEMTWKSIHVFILYIKNVKLRNWLITSNSWRKPSLKCSSKSCNLLRRSRIIMTLVGYFIWLCLVEICETVCCLSNSCDTRDRFAEASLRVAWLDWVTDSLWRYAFLSSSVFNSSYAFSS